MACERSIAGLACGMAARALEFGVGTAHEAVSWAVTCSVEGFQVAWASKAFEVGVAAARTACAAAARRAAIEQPEDIDKELLVANTTYRDLLRGGKVYGYR